MTERRRVPISRQTGEPILPEDELSASPPEPCTCPRLERDDWDEVESDWGDIAFVKTYSKAVMGVPVAFNSLRERLTKRADELDVTIPVDAMMLLGAGRFRRPVLLEVEAAGRNAKDIERPGGIAYTRLRPAPYGSMQKIVDETRSEAEARYGRAPDELYVWYLTCKWCSAELEYETLFVAHYATPPAMA